MARNDRTKIVRPNFKLFCKQVESVKKDPAVTAKQRLCLANGVEIALVVGWTNYDADIPQTEYYNGAASVAAKVGVLAWNSGMSEYDMDWIQPANDLDEYYAPLNLAPGEVYETEFAITCKEDIREAYDFAMQAFRANKEAIIDLAVRCQAKKDA